MGATDPQSRSGNYCTQRGLYGRATRRTVFGPRQEQVAHCAARDRRGEGEAEHRRRVQDGEQLLAVGGLPDLRRRHAERSSDAGRTQAAGCVSEGDVLAGKMRNGTCGLRCAAPERRAACVASGSAGAQRRRRTRGFSAARACTVPSSAALTKRNPLGANCTAWTQPEWRTSLRNSAPEPVSHSVTAPSPQPESTRAPVGEKHTHVTGALCCSTRISTPVARPQSRTVKSMEPEAAHSPSGEKAAVRTT